MTEEHESDSIGYTDVDGAGVGEILLRLMDTAAAWPEVQDLRRWSGEVLRGVGPVLDVGCGLADVLVDLAVTAPSERFVGVDASTDMLGEARRRVSAASVTVELHEADATALPFDDDEFGAARAERVMQWVEDPVAIAAEMVRVTRPGGSVVLIDTDWRTLWTNIADQELEREVSAYLPESWPQPAAGGFLTSYARAAGLVEVEARPVVHLANTWPEDGSSGLIPLDVTVNNMVAGGVRPEAAERWGSEVLALSKRGELFVTLTMVGVRGRVPHT